MNKLTYNEFLQQQFSRWQFESLIILFIDLYGKIDFDKDTRTLDLQYPLSFDHEVLVSRLRIKASSRKNDTKKALTSGFNSSLEYFNPGTLKWVPVSMLSLGQVEHILRHLNVRAINYMSRMINKK